MGFLAPAVPWIIKGGSLLGGMLAGKQAEKGAMARSPEEAANFTGATTAAGGLATQGTRLMQQGNQALQQPLSYYSTLLGGNRAQMAQATAGTRASLTDTYRGAERSLEQGGVRGAAADLAKGELARDRAGQIARLTTGVQPMAAAALSDMGTNLTSQGARDVAGAGSLYGDLAEMGTKNRVYGREEGAKTGSVFGSLIFDILSGIGKKRSNTPGPWAGGYQFPQ